MSHATPDSVPDPSPSAEADAPLDESSATLDRVDGGWEWFPIPDVVDYSEEARLRMVRGENERPRH